MKKVSMEWMFREYLVIVKKKAGCVLQPVFYNA